MKRSASPPSEQVSLGSASPDRTPKLVQEEIEDGSNCSICLQEISDQTILPPCSHEFCFECLLIWTKQSHRCPLCSREIGEYLIHNVRSKHDFSKHYLAPLRSSPVPQNAVTELNPRRGFGRRKLTTREQRQRKELNEVDRLQQSIGKRRWIYRNGLYAKHVASNTFTRYKPYPLPTQFSVSPDLISRTTSFVRRELQVWPNLDIEFLTTFTISIMKSIDIRSESAVKLLAEFLDMDSSYVEGGRHVNAEHFAHEIYSFVRSPYRDIFVYDDAVQYDISPEIPPPPKFHPRRRWRRNSPWSRSRTGSPSGSHSRSPSRSPPRSRSLQNFSPISITHNGSDFLLCSSPSSRHGNTEYIQQPLPASEMGSSALLRSNPDINNRDEIWENKEDSSLDHRNVLENQKPRGEQSEHPLFRAQVAVDNKGKQRAQGKQRQDFDNVVQGKPSKQEIKIQCEYDLGSFPSFFAQPQVIERKPPRNRTLRECVEAHLCGGRSKCTERNGGREDTDLDELKGYLYADKPAAMSSVLMTDQAHITGDDSVASIPSHQNVQNDKESAGHGNKAVDGQLSEGNVSHASLKVSQRETRIISPRIINTALLAIETSNQAIQPNQDGFISTDIGHVGKGRSSHAINNSADSHIRPRSRLLTRLDEEKRYAYAMTATDRTCLSAEHQIAEFAVNPHVVNSLALEDNLRRRARLRMKLAVEKRGIMGDGR